MTPTTQQPSTYSRWIKIEDALIWAETCHRLRSFKNDTWGRELLEGPIYPRRYEAAAYKHTYDKYGKLRYIGIEWVPVRLERAIETAIDNAKDCGYDHVCFHGISNLIDLNY